MICAVIHYVEKHLPHDKILVFSILERSFEQHIIPQLGQVVAHMSLNVVPVCAKDLPVLKVSRVKRLWNFDASQSTKPRIINAHEMNDLVSNRPMRIVHILRELFLG